MNIEILIWVVKVAHVGAISIWAGGLVALPFLLAERGGLKGRPLDWFERTARFVYIKLVSPAAFIAIGTGIALIFLRQTFVEWFSVKLLFVGMLVVLHMLTGRMVRRISEPSSRYGVVRQGAIASLSGLIAAMILFVVLGKPEIDSNAFAEDLFQPGGLGEAIGLSAQDLGDTMIPTP